MELLMNTKGIRISDLKNGKCISLLELLKDVPDPDQFNWALLWFDVTAVDKEGEYIFEQRKKINSAEKGIHCTFLSLIELSKKIFQEIEVLIIGCKIKENLHRYNKDQDMYETCDIVFEMIDGVLWEIFSKNTKWIDQLAKKYEKVEFISSNFQIE